jgi:hypothetical protein
VAEEEKKPLYETPEKSSSRSWLAVLNKEKSKGTSKRY